MSYADQVFISMCEDILENGTSTEGEKVRPHWPDGESAYTIKQFGVVNRYDLSKEFPALTLRKTYIKSAIDELLWIWQKKSNNVNDLKSHIWDEWADENGDLGPVYGAQWRNWNGEGIDQLKDLVNQLKHNPDSRRMIVTAWNPSQLGQMQLPPCHMMYQCYVAEGRLSLMLYQRSCDSFLGVPFNIASYALLTMMLAQVCGLEAYEFIHTFGDTHIYSNHFEQVKEQLSRTPCPLPTMTLNSEVRNLEDFVYEDFHLEGYDPWPTIKAPVAV